MPQSDALWYCCRQHSGPLVKECRALRPRLSSDDTRDDQRAKKEILRYTHTPVCRTQADRLELRLAQFGHEGMHYTLTFADNWLPDNFNGVRKAWRAFKAKSDRWKNERPFDWIYAIEGLHGDHRYHIHAILRYSDFSPAEVEWLWKYGSVDMEVVLQKDGGYRRLAEYLTKERTDGVWIPIGRHPWSCSRSLSQKIPPPEKWRDASGVIEIPDEVMWARRGQTVNDFGAYYYGSYIYQKDSALYLN